MVVEAIKADVLERLEDYVAEFAAGFDYVTRTRWAGVYLQGLLLDGERKSIEPLSQRVSVPGWHGDTEQALQQFVNQSVWDEQAVLQTYRRVMGEAFDDPAGVVVIDDTGFAKKGRHSVGGARQYSGTLGKTDNCQVAVSLHYAAPLGDYPLGLRLFLPESWTSQVERLQAVGVPRPKGRSPWRCWTWCGVRGCRTRRWWPMRATAPVASFGTRWKREVRRMWSASAGKK